MSTANDQELLEHLARHLAVANGETKEDAPLYQHLAHETLRLMKWSRQGFAWIKLVADSGKPTIVSQGQAMDGSTELALYRDELSKPLTLPPAEWKP